MRSTQEAAPPLASAMLLAGLAASTDARVRLTLTPLPNGAAVVR